MIRSNPKPSKLRQLQLLQFYPVALIFFRHCNVDIVDTLSSLHRLYRNYFLNVNNVHIVIIYVNIVITSSFSLWTQWKVWTLQCPRVDIISVLYNLHFLFATDRGFSTMSPMSTSLTLYRHCYFNLCWKGVRWQWIRR